jgi:hypothetical protein
MSYSTLRKYLRDVLGVTISRNLLRKLMGKVTDSLADPYDALCAILCSKRAGISSWKKRLGRKARGSRPMMTR